eukprot:402360-Lingulodinium_polyedra.AAC.1
MVMLCRHTGCKKRSAGGRGIGADLDGYMSLEHVVEVLAEKRLLGRIPDRVRSVLKQWIIFCLRFLAT